MRQSFLKTSLAVFTAYLFSASAVFAEAKGTITRITVMETAGATPPADGGTVQVLGPNYLAESAIKDEVLVKYVGEPLTMDNLNALLKDVVRYAQKQRRPVVDAYFPEQDLTTGNVRVMVTTGKLGALQSRGNEWVKSDDLHAQFDIKEGDEINLDHMTPDLEWINRSPFHYSDLIFTPGKRPGTTDVILETKDRIPFRPYAGVDNTGTSSTGRTRVRGGFLAADLLQFNSLLSYEYSQALDYDNFHAHSASYLMPLPWRDALLVAGSISGSSSNVADVFDSNGDNLQLMLAYKKELPHDQPFDRMNHDMTVGIEYKRLESDLEFGGTSVFNTAAEVNQFFGEYQGVKRDDLGYTNWRARAVVSPGGGTSKHDTYYFNLARPGADDTYKIANLRMERTLNLPYEFLGKLRAEGQLTDSNLLGSERLGITGQDAVRGYEEDALISDVGYRMNVELYTPAANPLKDGGLIDAKDELRGLIFFDYGYGRGRKYRVTTDRGEYVSSVGVGVRYDVTPNLAAKLDYGVQTRGDEESALHFSVIASY